jgi:hypothetical protein
MILKAISVKQPWTNLIVRGFKSIETRTWPTKYRGQIVICSSLQADKAALELYRPHAEKFGAISPITAEPAGMALCIAELYDCQRMIEAHERAALCHVYPGAYSLFLRNIQVFEPFPVKGKLGIFEIEVKGDKVRVKEK